MNKIPRILVSCPTAKAKNYTAIEWIANTQNFTYKNYDVVVFDNTDDNGENVKYLNELAANNGFMNFKAIKSDTNKCKSLIEKMCISHNDCREQAINGGYSHLLHLESDVICPANTVENLYLHKKQVAGGLFYRDSGISRKLMAQRRIYRSHKNIISENFLADEDIHFIDGTLKTVAHIGLGCVLINVETLKKIKFRFTENVDMHPDTYFAEDCFRNNIKIFADTNIICKHNNENWGVYGYTWK